MLGFGITENHRKATGRVDIGQVSEAYKRTLRRVAVNGIQPPVLGLDVVRVGQEDNKNRALVVVVPQSVDIPHLIYRGEKFGAPIRNHADTEWMREWQLESLYRQRLDARRHSDQAVQNLYDELVAGREIDGRAWMAVIAYHAYRFLVGNSIGTRRGPWSRPPRDCRLRGSAVVPLIRSKPSIA